MPKVESEIIQAHGEKRLRCTLPEHGAYVIGRESDCQIVIDDPEVSRHHARVTSSPEQLVLEDLGSTGGTFVAGQRVTQPVVLQPSQPIQVGSTILEVQQGRSAIPGRPAVANAGETARNGRPTSLEDSIRSRSYEIGHEVAHGGMGAILSARDTNIHRTVAMKRMRGDTDMDDDRKLRFVQEAQLTGQLEHPNIVPVHELGVDQDGKIFYTMKFVKGVTLHEVLHGIRDGVAEMIARFPLAQLLTVFQKVCDAVAFAHSRGVIHRDLKPENIMIGEYGEVLVMDWGLAKKVGSVECRVSSVECRVSSVE
jgi:tRNA A-37 threonylcarbamoyl transferase component Bud32